MEEMKARIKKKTIIRLLIGFAIGGVLGYAYYHFIGCNSGSCPITSNPWSSILYGTLIGGLLAYK